MQTTYELTAAEARAVTHLWRLRQKLSPEQSPVPTPLLAEILGIGLDEVTRMARSARRALPSNLFASNACLAVFEAETVLAIHATSGTTGSERLPLSAVAGALGVTEGDLKPIVRTAQERIAFAEEITRAPVVFPGIVHVSEDTTRENPYSWQIMWTVVLMIMTLLGIVFLLAR